MSKTRAQLVAETMEQQKNYFLEHAPQRKTCKGTIYTKDYEGGFHITTDTERNSLAEPVYIDVPDLDTMKMLGTPDELAVMGDCDTSCKELPEWSDADDGRDFSQFSILEKSRLCHAFNQYVYRDSNAVKSYEQPLNQHYFPMKVPVFDLEDIVVSKDHPLFLGQPGEETTTVHFNSITLEPGAEVINLGQTNLLSEKVVSEGTEEEGCILANVGVNGADRKERGTPGYTGSNGVPGAPGISGKDYCAANATDGQPGGDGGKGGTGNPGGNGTNGSPLEKKTEIMEGLFYLYSSGGDGGKGGPGGKGGTGGHGGDGGAADGHCGASNPGRGGNGGNGGTGGNGGDAGDGGDINIEYDQTQSPTASFVILTPEEAKKKGYPTAIGGAAGEGGPGGDGGQGGWFYDDSGKLVRSGDEYRGSAGQKGESGQVGTSGTHGTIRINGSYTK